MQSTYTAVVVKRGRWWVGWIKEVAGVNAQERTRETLLTSLRETLREALDFNAAEAVEAAEAGYQEEAITL